MINYKICIVLMLSLSYFIKNITPNVQEKYLQYIKSKELKKKKSILPMKSIFMRLSNFT